MRYMGRGVKAGRGNNYWGSRRPLYPGLPSRIIANGESLVRDKFFPFLPKPAETSPQEKEGPPQARSAWPRIAVEQSRSSRRQQLLGLASPPLRAKPAETSPQEKE